MHLHLKIDKRKINLLRILTFLKLMNNQNTIIKCLGLQKNHLLQINNMIELNQIQATPPIGLIVAPFNGPHSSRRVRSMAFNLTTLSPINLQGKYHNWFHPPLWISPSSTSSTSSFSCKDNPYSVSSIPNKTKKRQNQSDKTIPFASKFIKQYKTLHIDKMSLHSQP